MIPIRRSNKPPYIYWRKLVIIGLALLFLSLPLAILSTEITFKVLYRTEGIITGHRTIPTSSLPTKVLIANTLFSNLTLRIGGNSSFTCTLEDIKISEDMGNNSKVLQPQINGGIAHVSSWGLTFFRVESPANCSIIYEYVIYEVSRPYLYLVFISAIISIVGATSGALGIVLMFKQRYLRKLEERYI